jgi:hypothetical protein
MPNRAIFILERKEGETGKQRERHGSVAERRNLASVIKLTIGKNGAVIAYRPTSRRQTTHRLLQLVDRARLRQLIDDNSSTGLTNRPTH